MTELSSLGTLQISHPPRQRIAETIQTKCTRSTRQKAGCVISIGDSIYETHPVYGYQLQRMVRLMDKKLIVINPRWAKLCEWATLWLAPRPGTEETLVHGIARVIADAGLMDQAY